MANPFSSPVTFHYPWYMTLWRSIRRDRYLAAEERLELCDPFPFDPLKYDELFKDMLARGRMFWFPYFQRMLGSPIWVDGECWRYYEYRGIIYRNSDQWKRRTMEYVR